MRRKVLKNSNELQVQKPVARNVQLYTKFPNFTYGHFHFTLPSLLVA